MPHYQPNLTALDAIDKLTQYKNHVRHNMRTQFITSNPTVTNTEIEAYMANVEVRWIRHLTRIPSTVAESPIRGEE